MLNVDEDEEKWLAEGIAGVQHNALYMHRALVLPFLPKFYQTLAFLFASDLSKF